MAGFRIGAESAVAAAGQPAGDCVVRAARPGRSATVKQKAAEEEEDAMSDWSLGVSHGEAKTAVKLDNRKRK